MTHEQLCQSLLDYLAEVSVLPVARETRLLDDAVIDSFDIVGLLGHMEQVLDMQFEPEKVIYEKFADIDSIATWALSLH